MFLKQFCLTTACLLTFGPAFGQGTLAPLDIPPIDLANHSTNGGVTGVLPAANGGTGTTTTSGLATSGANSNITSLSGLTTPLTTGQGGTGAANLDAFATSGANSNITSLTGLTTPLSGPQGGTGHTTAAITDGQLLIGKTSDRSLNLSTLTSGSNVTITNGGGTITVSAANTYVPTVTATADAGVSAAVDHTYLLDTTSNAITFTLPTAVGHTGHQIVVFLQAYADTVTVATTSSQTINGASPTQTLTAANQSFTFMSDGANWVILAAT